MRLLIILSLLFLLTFAEDNSTLNTNELDQFHNFVSKKIQTVSSNIDNPSASMSNYFINFFKDETFIDTNNKSYLRVRLGPEFNKEEGNKRKIEFHLNLHLPHMNDSLNLFIGQTFENNISNSSSSTESSDPSIGIRYYIPEFMGHFKSNFTIGVRGINSFTRLYFLYNIDFFNWRIYPTQELEYRSQEHLSSWGYYERTRLYFDRRISKTGMIRLQLYRSSECEKMGQRYGTSLTYFNTFNRKKVGFRCYLSVSGDSEYSQNNPDYISNAKEHKGINNYSAGIVWKQALYKNWLFYDIEPLAEWDRKYYYQRNYIVRFNLELWFGSN